MYSAIDIMHIIVISKMWTVTSYGWTICDYICFRQILFSIQSLHQLKEIAQSPIKEHLACMNVSLEPAIYSSPCNILKSLIPNLNQTKNKTVKQIFKWTKYKN